LRRPPPLQTRQCLPSQTNTAGVAVYDNGLPVQLVWWQAAVKAVLSCAASLRANRLPEHPGYLAETSWKGQID
jgi:hypothetical protein